MRGRLLCRSCQLSIMAPGVLTTSSSNLLVACWRSLGCLRRSSIAGRAPRRISPKNKALREHSSRMNKSQIRTVLEMIKFEHSVFALPFALVGALLAARAANSLPTLRQILWIVVAMLGARSAAMTVNRIADMEYDRRNPRTAKRALPKGELSLGFAW